MDITFQIFIQLMFGLVGVVMIAAVIFTLVKIVRNPSRTAQVSSEKEAERLAQTMSADELYVLAKSHLDKTTPDADYSLGKEIMAVAAEKGNAEAQLYMGDNLDYDDNIKAVEWYKKAAAQGLDEACEKLGDIYNYGREFGSNKIEPDATQALKWYTPLAEKGNIEVQKTLALMCSLDLDDEEAAIKWYEKAAQTGDTEAISWLVMHYDAEDDTQNAVKWCKTAAEAGDAEHMYELGRLYEFAEPSDMENAVLWYRKAADNGYRKANVKLALLYMEGDGVEKDQRKAFEMFQTEADAGSSWAKYNVAMCYKNGTVVQKDIDKAVQLFKQSQDFDMSVYELALCYENGTGVEKSEEKVFELLNGAGEDSYNEDILFKLGECYFYGRGTDKDKEKARKLWRKAAWYGSDEAKHAIEWLLGEIYTEEDEYEDE